MNHIDEFIIDHFRGLRDLKIEGLSQINLLVGGTNTGKTSVLEALSLFCDPLNWRTWYNSAAAREIMGGPGGQLLQVWLFPQGNGNISNSHEISLSASGTLSLKKVSARYTEFTEIMRNVASVNAKGVVETHDLEATSIEIGISAFQDGMPLERTLTFSNNPFSRYENEQESPILPVQIITPFSHVLSFFQRDIWSDVVKSDQKAEAVKLLQYFDPAIQDIDIVSEGIYQSLVTVKHEKLGRAPLSTFGDGLRRVFVLASVMPKVKNGLLLIDELEASIHTKALQKTLDWLVKSCIQNDIQLFATTHSLEALDTVIEVSRDVADLTTFRLEKAKQTIKVTRFDKDMIIRLREELGAEVR